jgi:hypothetical protein
MEVLGLENIVKVQFCKVSTMKEKKLPVDKNHFHTLMNHCFQDMGLPKPFEVIPQFDTEYDPNAVRVDEKAVFFVKTGETWETGSKKKKKDTTKTLAVPEKQGRTGKSEELECCGIGCNNNSIIDEAHMCGICHEACWCDNESCHLEQDTPGGMIGVCQQCFENLEDNEDEDVVDDGDGDDDSDSDRSEPARKKRKTDQDSKTSSDNDDESGATPAGNEEEQPPSDEG